MKVQVRGATEAASNFERRAVRLPSALRSEADHSMTYLKDRVPPYPPPLPLSRYSRTGTLGRNYYTDVKPLGAYSIVGVLGNRTEYAPVVISSEVVGGLGPQAAVHAGRWFTLQEHLSTHSRQVMGFFTSAVRSAIT